MKNRTIEQAIALLSDCISEKNEKSLNERIAGLRAKLQNERQRKEKKSSKINSLKSEINRLNKIIENQKPFGLIENTAHDEIYQRGYKQGVNDEARRLSWPFGVRQQSLFGFELSPTNKIIINNGVEFKRLLDMFNEAYEKQCNRKQNVCISVCANLTNRKCK